MFVQGGGRKFQAPGGKDKEDSDSLVGGQLGDGGSWRRREKGKPAARRGL